MGKALQRVEGSEYLSIYQANKMNDFKQLDIVYKKIEEGRIDFAPMQDLLFKDIVEYIINTQHNIANIYEFTDLLALATKECIKDSSSSDNCIIERIEADIAGICLVADVMQQLI